MTRLPLLLAAAAALVLPIGAHAQAVDPVLNAFQSVCGGDYDTIVRSAAATAGWADTPVVANTDPSVSITDKTARSKTVGGVDLTLLATRGLRHTKGGDVPVTTCELSSNKPDPALINAAKSWVGVDPDASPDSTLAVYYVKPGPGKPDHIGQAGLNDAMNSGGFAILKFQQNSDSAILVYQIYTK